VKQGDVFWGLPGVRFDGTGFASDAFARGASGAVVGGKYVQPWPSCWSLEVADAQQSLEKLARWNRARFRGRVVAVTGSVGKTTTRQMIHAVLGSCFEGLASPKNYNNQVGVPLSMLAIEPDHDYAVLELAASARGEIAQLAALAGPHVGVITRAGDAHLGGFGSLDAVAASKAEILTALPTDGWAVLAGDDLRLRRLAPPSQKRIVWFGRGLDNDLIATNVEYRQGCLSFAVDGTTMSVNVWGRHYLASALASIAVGRIFGICDAEIAHGLRQFQPAPMRCQVRQVGGATIIDDTYSASPVAMRAALELLRDFDAPGRRIVVCGDMRELGPSAGDLHRQIGDDVVTLCGADLLVACGDYAHDVVAGARAAGMPHDSALAYERPEDVLAHGAPELHPGDVMLIKGSRAMAMERLVEALESAGQACAV